MAPLKKTVTIYEISIHNFKNSYNWPISKKNSIIVCIEPLLLMIRI